MPIPLTNARTASVGKNETANLLESSHLTVTGDSSTDLLGTGRDRELALRLETVRGGLLGDGGRAGHVLVRRVRAGADKGDLELRRPTVLLDLLGELRDGGRQIGSEGTVDVRLELRQVLQKLFH